MPYLSRHSSRYEWRVSAAGLQEIHNLKQKIFKMEKAHNDTLRDVSFLNDTNKEVNDQLDYCSTLVTKAAEDMAAFKTGAVFPFVNTISSVLIHCMQWYLRSVQLDCST